ncbi:hypothetical protein BH10ACI2_BH10ACI2_18340 [soil metagenome]
MEIDAFILIGGRSSRLGTDKAFVELDGKTLAIRAAETVESAMSPARLKFVISTGDQFGADLLFRLGRPVVTDLRPGFGAWSGLDTALGYAMSEWCLVLACDLPFVTVEFLRLLSSLATDEIDAVVPRQIDGRLQPLCAIYRSTPLRAIVGEIFTGKNSVPPIASIFDRLKTRIVEPYEYANLAGAEKMFLNINTETDLAAAFACTGQPEST